MPQDGQSDGKISLAKANRKIAKPIMEKKRRARINASLNELKTLLVEVLQKEGCRHSSKMEKADILEMAVRHLKNLQRQQNYVAGAPTQHREGYQTECSPTAQMRTYLTQAAQDSRIPHPLPDSTVASPTSIKLPVDINRNILPNAKPVMMNPNDGSSIGQTTPMTFPNVQPIVTQNSNGELTLVFPQPLVKQTGHSGVPGFVFPLYTSQKALASSISPDSKVDQPVMISINMPPTNQQHSSAFTKVATSCNTMNISHPNIKAPLSPVWRPW